MTLQELNIGDYFYAKSDDKKRIRFHVLGNPEFNALYGSATRKCANLLRGIIEDKSCRLEVTPTHKPKY